MLSPPEPKTESGKGLQVEEYMKELWVSVPCNQIMNAVHLLVLIHYRGPHGILSTSACISPLTNPCHRVAITLKYSKK
jgi:hypothetical protein